MNQPPVTDCSSSKHLHDSTYNQISTTRLWDSAIHLDLELYHAICSGGFVFSCKMIYALVVAAMGVVTYGFRLNAPQQATRNPIFYSKDIVSVTRSATTVGSSSAARYAIMAQTYTRDKTRDEYDDDRTGLVLDDFEQLLDSMVIFKRVFGDYDIPVKFEVPATNPWPSHLHGLRLGRRLEKLLSSEDFFSAYPDKVKELSKLGFAPTIDSLVDDWRIIHDAMKVYKEVYGNLRVASKYEVPDDAIWPRYCRSVKLGVRVAAIRSAGRYVKDHPKRKQDLDDLGFEWRLRDSTSKQPVVDDLFEHVYEALVCYKREVDEELNVPSDFVVPNEEPWPESTRGLTLGAHVISVRAKDKLVYGHEERERRLNELGFQWEETGRTVFSKKRFDIVYTALKAYKEIYGNLIVPQAFVVPLDDEFWPEESRGLKLGARVNAIRCQGTLVSNSPERRDKLNQLGFSWELPTHTRRKKKGEEDPMEEVAPVVAAVPEEKKTPLEVLAEILPAVSSGGGSSKWPHEEHDDPSSMENKQQRIANMPIPGDDVMSEYRPALAYDPSRMFEPLMYRELAAETVREYMQGREYSPDPDVRRQAHFEGHLAPQDFHRVITRGIPLEDIKAMKKIGYRILEFGRFNWDSVMSGFIIYKEAYGHIDIPHEFIVDEDVIALNIGFDEKYEGMRLGEAIAGLRIGDIDGLEDSTRRKALDAMGMVWGDKKVYQRYRFVPMIMGLKVYKHLYGFPMPHYNFIVPDEPQWPFWMVNMPLGEWSAVLRVQQKMVIEHYPHRRDMLNSLEYLWWVPPGHIPAKYFRAVK